MSSENKILKHYALLSKIHSPVLIAALIHVITPGTGIRLVFQLTLICELIRFLVFLRYCHYVEPRAEPLFTVKSSLDTTT